MIPPSHHFAQSLCAAFVERRGDVSRTVTPRGLRVGGICYLRRKPSQLLRYLDEFNFRYSNRAAMGVDDSTRAVRAIKGGEGKRLTYQAVGGA